MTYLSIELELYNQLQEQEAKKAQKKFIEKDLFDILLAYSRNRPFAGESAIRGKTVESIMEARYPKAFKRLQKRIQKSEPMMQHFLALELPVKDTDWYREFEQELMAWVPDVGSAIKKILLIFDETEREEIVRNLSRAFIFNFLGKKIPSLEFAKKRFFSLYCKALYKEGDIAENFENVLLQEIASTLTQPDKLNSYIEIIGNQKMEELYVKVLDKNLNEENITMLIRMLSIIRDDIANGLRDLSQFEFVRKVLQKIAEKEKEGVISRETVNQAINRYHPGSITSQEKPKKEVKVNTIKVELHHQRNPKEESILGRGRRTFKKWLSAEELPKRPKEQPVLKSASSGDALEMKSKKPVPSPRNQSSKLPAEAVPLSPRRLTSLGTPSLSRGTLFDNKQGSKKSASEIIPPHHSGQKSPRKNEALSPRNPKGGSHFFAGQKKELSNEKVESKKKRRKSVHFIQ